uniref:CUB domain-containing protein n=1 Tax=Angiostrongylus cantonensis TaxID=6313 RepID=A0A0K0CT09_ANGCA
LRYVSQNDNSYVRRLVTDYFPNLTTFKQAFQIRLQSPATNTTFIARFHPEAVDKFSIVAFPLTFTLFNVSLKVEGIVQEQTIILQKVGNGCAMEQRPGHPVVVSSAHPRSDNWNFICY